MKFSLTILMAIGFVVVYGQNNYVGLSTSQSAGVMSLTLNPAELAKMKSKVDINLFSSDFQISNNALNLTPSSIGSFSDDFDSLIRSESVNPVDFRVGIDIMGPSIAVSILPKLSVALHSRARVGIVAQNIDVAFANGILNNSINNGFSSSYSINNSNLISTAVAGWAEIGVSGAYEVYRSKKHSLSAGAGFKLLLPGFYANTYLKNLNVNLYENSTGDVYIQNSTANVGVVYSGSNDPLNGVWGNMIGGINGLGLDIGGSYSYMDSSTDKYIFKIGASVTDIGTLAYPFESKNMRLYNMNTEGAPGGIVYLKDIKGKDLDDAIEKIEATGAVTTLPKDTNMKISLPTAFNLYGDARIWKFIYCGFQYRARMNNANDPNAIRIDNYLSIIPRVYTKLFEAYIPLSFGEIQGTTVGAGFRFGPFFLGSNSILSAVTSSQNKAIDFNFGLRVGIGKSK
jgi:hypothetical protein